MKPICVPCQRFYRPKQNDFFFLEGMPKENDAPAGTAKPDAWTPYKIWAADLWECEGCGHQILSGFGRQPIGEHYQPDFAEKVRVLGADRFQVNDC